MPASPGEAGSDAAELFAAFSNHGRWGPDDEVGTLNYVTTAKVRAAMGGVRSGRIVSLGRVLEPLGSGEERPVVHRVLLAGAGEQFASHDSVEIAPHGFTVTHVDALGHVFFRGIAYNGRRREDCLSSRGLSFASVLPLAQGIVTRGVLLDVAGGRGVESLGPGEYVTPSDLDAAEKRANVTVEEGDAVFVRVGAGSESRTIHAPTPEAPRAGLAIECLSWLYDHRVSVYSGDCIERLPSENQDMPLPLHMIGLAGMGLVILDNPDMEILTRAVLEEERADFLLCCAPLPIAGGTGSAVNPLAIF